MQETHIWRSQYILLRKITLTLFLAVACSAQCWAQGEGMNNTLHDSKKFYFGITVGFNTSQYKITHDKWFIDHDSITEITPLWKPGLQLGLMGNMRLNSFIDIRTIPSFVLREKSVRFRLKDRQDPTNNVFQTSSFESILFHWPFEVKFKSDRQNNFRFYAIAGGKIDYDFNSSVSKRRQEELLRVKPWDLGANAGLGFEFYFPNFILAPEIKFSQGLINVLDKTDADEQTAKAIERLNTRMIILSLHIQG
jgi:hypothetical protein